MLSTAAWYMAEAFAIAASADWVEVLDNPSQTTMETVAVDFTQGIALASLLRSLTSTRPTLATVSDVPFPLLHLKLQ